MAIPDISTIKISQLNEVSELQNNSALVANVAGETKKITFGNVMNQIEGEINPQISNLTADLNQEKQTRAAADATLQGNITAETNARTAADSDLNTAITNEVTARASADRALGDRIDAEATARASADSALGDRIDNIGTLTPNTFTSVAITANSWSPCKDISLPKGKYIINAFAEFAQATAYQYTMRIIIGSDSYKIRNFGNNGGGSNFTILADLSQTTSVSLSLYTDITTTATGFLQVMKVN